MAVAAIDSQVKAIPIFADAEAFTIADLSFVELARAAVSSMLTMKHRPTTTNSAPQISSVCVIGHEIKTLKSRVQLDNDATITKTLKIKNDLTSLAIDSSDRMLFPLSA